MTADTPSPLVPKLRFAEFRDAGDWMTKILDNQGGFLSSLTGKTARDFDTGDATFIPYMNVFSNTFTDISDLRSVNVGSDESQNAVAKGDVFFTISSEVPEEAGMSSVLLERVENCYLNSFCALFRFDDGNSANPVFLGYLLRSALARAHLSRGAQGATRYNISRATFRSLPLQLPSGREQQKIADCLGSLDDLIAAEGRKLDALRQHKQGLLQQLFPKPGETRPRLRFPEFEDAPDWEEVALGALLDRSPDYGVNAAAVPFSESLPTYIRITDINEDGQFATHARVSVDIHPTNEQYLENGDIVLARTGASVGKSYRYREEDGRLVYAGFLIRVRPNPERLLSQFLAAYLSTWSYWHWVRLTSERSGQPGINATEYASIPLPLPADRRTLAEQQKVADCLTSIDDQLNAQARKLDTLKQHKQGLLQQLFPPLDE